MEISYGPINEGTAEYFSYLGSQKFFGNAEGGDLGKVGSRLKIYS
jgi:hypothetical protein